MLDGRNRLAAKLAGVEPKVREFTGTAAAALRLVWSLNFKRRHLTPSQAAVCGLEFEALIAEYTAEAEVQKLAGQRAGGKKAGRGRPIALPSREGKAIPPPKVKGFWQATKAENWTATKLAKQVGVSRATVERAQAPKKASPEKLAEVKAGKKSLSQAGREVKKATMKVVAQLPTGKFLMFYADPPWS